RLTADGRFAVNVASRAWPEDGFWRWLADHLPDWCLPSDDELVVTETATGTERLRVGIGERHDVLLSDDGGTLACVQVERSDDGGAPQSVLVRIGDVGPRRAWIRAIGWTILAGVILLVLKRRRYRTVCRKRTAAIC